MAKINRRTAGGGKTHRVGPTFFTERTRPANDWEGERIYREAYRLRSDGTVQTRIISTRPADPASDERITKHSSAFRNLGRLVESRRTAEDLRGFLERRGYTIVEESWR